MTDQVAYVANSPSVKLMQFLCLEKEVHGGSEVLCKTPYIHVHTSTYPALDLALDCSCSVQERIRTGS